MRKKIIAKISEGLGNQLFMYANAYALSKKNNFEFLIDPYSGYYQKKHIYNFYLDRLNISSKIASKNLVFANKYRNFVKKILLFIDKFKINKKFVFENKDHNKKSFFSELNFKNTNQYFFLDGNFESEKYFKQYRSDILNEFKIRNTSKFFDNKYLDLIKNNNVISICVRQHRFSERVANAGVQSNILKSQLFVENTVSYIKKALDYFKGKVKDPYYLVWSNDFKNLNQYFDNKDFIFVENEKDKAITDFYLLTQCKYFIVGPSTFHWWGAWLSPHEGKVCVRPKDINPSNNIDFWPESWIVI